ncbi:MAG: hypothetical protein ABI051_13765 [Vicinamibacterales bacterium]
MSDRDPLLHGFGLAFLLVILTRTAWWSDAALLARRSAEMAATGGGLQFNAAERVQTFDHPLWTFVLILVRLTAGETYVAALVVSIILSVACLWLLLRRTRHPAGALFVLAALTLSPTFVAYSTSGLGTPLLHLFVIAAALAATTAESSSRAAARLAVVVGLGALTHWTFLPIALPALFAICRRRPAAWTASMLLIALGPLLVWWAWAYWYYGAAQPLGAIADHAAAVPWPERIETGIEFVRQSTRLDPMLSSVIAAGVVTGFLAWGLDALLALGCVLGTAIVVINGGSPNAGLGLTMPYAVAVFLVTRGFQRVGPWAAGASLLVMGLLVTRMPSPTFTSGSEYGKRFRPTARARDARAEMFQSTGLIRESRGRRGPSGAEATRARQVSARGETVGVSSRPGEFAAVVGLSMHVIDPEGLTDPLLARLPPAVGVRRAWGAPRRLPDGYVASLPGNAGKIADPALTTLVEELHTLTRGVPAGVARLLAAYHLPDNASRLIAQSSYGPVRTSLAAIAAGNERPLELREGGVIADVGSRRSVSSVTAVLSARFDYDVVLIDRTDNRAMVTLPRATWSDVPDQNRRATFDGAVPTTAVWFRCGRGTGRCVIAEIALAP